MSHSLVHIVMATMLFGLLIFLSIAGPLNFVLDWSRKGVDVLATPVRLPFNKVKTLTQIFFGLQDLSERNVFLTRQVEELTSELAVLEKAREENKFLKEALGFSTSSRLELVAAEIIAWDPLSLDPRLTLNRGENHGLKVGAAVVVPGPVMVGIVTEVYPLTSQMELLTSSHAAVNAEVIPSGATGIVRGDLGLGLSIDFLSQDVEIDSGDRVLTSGLGGLFPKNLLIGDIVKTRSNDSELFQKATVIPATSLRDIRQVFVIKN